VPDRISKTKMDIAEKAMWECLEYLDAFPPKQAAQRISSRLSKLDRAMRMTVLMGILDEAQAEYFWPIFLDGWPDFEFPHRWDNLVDRLHAAYGAMPAYNFMSSDNRAFFDSLSNNIKIYRGASREFRLGVSWTIDIAKAHWFARRFDEDTAAVFSGTVWRRDVLAVFTDRQESEILCDPLVVRDVNIRRERPHIQKG
jgi:hypothetical protein